MASGEGMDTSKPPLELRFVDHVECKIQSPEKEVISPTKVSKKDPLVSSFTGVNGTLLNGNEPDTANTGKIKEDENESRNSDSGLDSQNTSSETAEENYIDRQESYAAVDKPEQLTSPNKTVDTLFNFLNSESSQSLDALNNNSEVIVVEGSDGETETENAQTATKDMYLGKEVALHEGKGKDAKSVQDKKVIDSPMNLYWYTSNLDVDVAELEAFKVSQTENVMSANLTSNLEVTVGNGCYQTKNVDVDLESSSQNIYKSETNFDIKTEPAKRDSWSPAFESASSRILDLATELKSDPKRKKNRDNETIRDAVEPDAEKHPWGLDVEDKVRTEVVKEASDELPDIGTITDTENKQKTMQVDNEMITQENRSDEMGALRNEAEDVTDAVGYIELNDKPFVQTDILNESAELEKGKGLTVEENMQSKDSEDKLMEKVEDDYSEDMADAVGYMELKDRPVEQVLEQVARASEQSVLETSKSEITQGTVDNSRIGSTSLENQIMQYQSSEQILRDKEDTGHSEDVADAIGYMELKDRPTEKTFTASDQTVLETSRQQAIQKTVSENRTETNFKCLESQVKGVEVNKDFRKEVDQSIQTVSEGKDVPDARLDQIEQIEKVETAYVQSPLQTIVAEQKKESVRTKPFEPFHIKRKYLITNNSEEKLQMMGGIFLETETLIDEYLDDQNYSLILDDCWLRLRNKKFEMKVNAAFGIGPNKSPSVEIITNESEIQEMLMKKYAAKLEQSRRVSERQLDVLIDALDISEFVTFETTRKKYQMDDFIVTIDVTNFGFQVGEVEIVANSLAEMMTDLVDMDALAVKLGFRPLQNN